MERFAGTSIHSTKIRCVNGGDLIDKFEISTNPILPQIMNNTISQIEISLEKPITVPLYTFIALGAAIFALFTALCCTCCCNRVVCCCPWRRMPQEAPEAQPYQQPLIIGAPPDTSRMVLRSHEIVNRRRGVATNV